MQPKRMLSSLNWRTVETALLDEATPLSVSTAAGPAAGAVPMLELVAADPTVLGLKTSSMLLAGFATPAAAVVETGVLAKGPLKIPARRQIVLPSELGQMWHTGHDEHGVLSATEHL